MDKSSHTGMTIGPVPRMLLAEAARRGCAFALWRRPGQARVEAAIALSPIARQPLFDGGAVRPAFVMNAFDCGDGGVAEAIIADLLLDGDALHFIDATGRAAAQPCSTEQAAFLRAAKEGGPQAVLRASAGAAMPRQTGKQDYLALVAGAVAAIRAQRLDKVVLSRAECRRLPVGSDLLELYERLAARHPNAFVCLIQRPGESAWLTATPETLLRWDADGALRTMALAGTQTAADDADLSAVRWSDKLVGEQALVRGYIRAAFAACGIRAVDESEPRTVRAGNLVHLRSEFTAHVPPGEVARARAFLRALHPTSAVCGQPRQAALEYLRRHEGYDRSLYCGYIGPAGIDGATHLFVNLRTAQLIGDTAVLYVGGGIVADSDPEAEWIETAEKTKTVGAVLAQRTPASIA